MPRTELYQLRPLGWETDPEEESIRFSSLDYLAACTFNSYALFFKLKDEERSTAVTILKEGLERTLAQCRQLVGTVEKNEHDDDHSFVKKRNSTVKFVVKYFEPEDAAPSMSDLEKAHFVSSGFDTNSFVVDGIGIWREARMPAKREARRLGIPVQFHPRGGSFLSPTRTTTPTT
jgi:hypothetical protein